MAFDLLDALLFTSRPTSAELGLINCDPLYQGPLYDEGQEPGSTAPLRTHVESLVAATTADYVVFDIESVINQADYITMIGWARQVRPNVQYSVYGYGPRNLDGIGNTINSAHASYISWQATNDSDALLLAACDFASPTFYFRHGRMQQTFVNVSAQIVEARRINGSKPLLPFIWPFYIESLALPKALEIVGSLGWRQWLEFLRTGSLEGIPLGSFWGEEWRCTGTDGALLWGGNAIPWDANAAWWAETQSFQAAAAAEVPPAHLRLRLS